MKTIIAFTLALATFNVGAAPSSDEQVAKIALGIRKNSEEVTKRFLVGGYADGLAGFMRVNQLVITHVIGYCSSAKASICQIDAYVTRTSYRKHRVGDSGAFCGALLRWESPASDMKRWSPTSGLAANLAAGREQLALELIDDKDRSYCNR